jgi:hypothetical protein
MTLPPMAGAERQRRPMHTAALRVHLPALPTWKWLRVVATAVPSRSAWAAALPASHASPPPLALHAAPPPAFCVYTNPLQINRLAAG